MSNTFTGKVSGRMSSRGWAIALGIGAVVLAAILLVVYLDRYRARVGGQVRRCVFTNYCEGLDQVHKPVTCKLWDHVDLDDGVPLTPDGRRRLVAPAWEPAPR